MISLPSDESAQQHEEPVIFSYSSEPLLAKETHRAVETTTSLPKAVNGSLYGCKAQQPSCKRKVKPLQLKNTNRQFHIISVLCYLTGLLFFLLASSPKIQVVSINFTSRPEACQQPAAPAEPSVHSEEPRDAGGAAAAALRAADRCQSIRQACRGGLGRETLLSMSAEPPGCLGITKEAW